MNTIKTVDESQRLNEQILKALGRSDIVHPMGADRQIGRGWGQGDARDSEAAQAIIQSVNSLPEGEKLDILAIGAMSNLASALILAPENKQRTTKAYIKINEKALADNFWNVLKN